MDPAVKAQVPIEDISYEKKVQCCGGGLAFSEPEKPQEMVKGIIEAAYDHGADMIVTPSPVCQMNVEVRRHRRHLRHRIQHAGGLLLHPDGRRVRLQRQGSGARRIDHPGQEAG
jgi:Fe-S oxidoreductase